MTEVDTLKLTAELAAMRRDLSTVRRMLATVLVLMAIPYLTVLSTHPIGQFISFILGAAVFLCAVAWFVTRNEKRPLP